MKKTYRRILSVLLSVVLALSAAGVAVFAEGEAGIRVYTSAEGRADGELYVDFDSVEDALKAQISRTELAGIVYDMGLGENIARTFFNYLTVEKFPELWEAAKEAYCYHYYPESGRTPSDTVFDYDNWERDKAEELFYDDLQADGTAPGVIAAINEDLGVGLTSLDPIVNKQMDELERLGMAYIETYYPVFIAQADGNAETKAAAVKAAEWYLETRYGRLGLVAYADGAEWAEATMMYGPELLPTLDEVGSDWRPIVVTDDPATLSEGDYYVTREFLLSLIADEIDAVFGDQTSIVEQDPFTGDETEITK